MSAASHDFETLVREHSALVARIAATYERRPALIEEMVQEVFLAVHRALPTFRGEASLKTFIARIAHNIGVDHVRRATRRLREVPDTLAESLPDPDAPGEEQTDLALCRERLVAAVRDLPLSMRQVVSLHLEGFTNVEIGEALSVAPNAVGVRLHRAKDALREAMSDRPRRERVA